MRSTTTSTTTTSADVNSFGASDLHQIVMFSAEVSNGNFHSVESAAAQVAGTTAAHNTTEAQQPICDNDLKARDSVEEIMCAHELITLGQNCDFRMESLAPTSNSSSNQTLRNCKLVNIPNRINNKLLIPNLPSQTRIPNLDGNYSDESSDTEQFPSKLGILVWEGRLGINNLLFILLGIFTNLQFLNV
jgi:hypothetical protein